MFLYEKLAVSVSEQNLMTKLEQNWKFEVAPCPSDIIWPNFNKSSSFRTLKRILLNFILFCLTVLIITPLSVSLTILSKLLITDTEQHRAMDSLHQNSRWKLKLLCSSLIVVFNSSHLVQFQLRVYSYPCRLCFLL